MYKNVWNTMVERLKAVHNNNIKPTRMRLRLTLKCNMKCKFCIRQTYNEKDYSKKELGTKDFIRIVRMARRMGVKLIEVSGNGEPFCHPGIMEILSEIKRQGLFGELTTNGSLLTAKDTEKIVKIGWDLIRFSIDGADKETHDFLRGTKGAFDKATFAMYNINNLNPRLKKDLQVIAINFILTNRNYCQLLKLLTLMKDLGATKLWIMPLLIQPEIGRDLMLNPKEDERFKESLPEALKLAGEYGIESNISDFMPHCPATISEKGSERVPFCFMPWTDIVIGEDGSVGPCTAFYFNHANIRKGLTGLWQGKEFESLRRSLIKNELCKKCKSCKQWWGPHETVFLHRAME